MKLAIETWLLLLCGLLDLVATITLVETGRAYEGNSLMAFYLREFGIPGLCLAKLAMLLLPVGILEYARRATLLNIRLVLRLVVVGYMLVYFGGTLSMNRGYIGSWTGPYLARVFPLGQQRAQKGAPGAKSRPPAVIPLRADDMYY